MDEWLKFFQDLLATSAYMLTVEIALITIGCIWQMFVMVLTFRAALWLWNWLSLAEARNWQAWQPNVTTPTFLQMAQRYRSKWNGILWVTFIIAVGLVVTVSLFLYGQPYSGTMAALLLLLLAVGTLFYVFLGG